MGATPGISAVVFHAFQRFGDHRGWFWKGGGGVVKIDGSIQIHINLISPRMGAFAAELYLVHFMRGILHAFVLRGGSSGAFCIYSHDLFARFIRTIY
jgi:hypothetical protein